MQHTALYDAHVKANARMVEFSGWQMPINFGSQIEEHHQVRRHAGMFDVSHMTVVDVRGSGARAYIRHLLANDIDRLTVSGRALYSCMLNDAGGVLDDLICYFLDEEHFRLVVNAATRDKDLAWMNEQVSSFDASVNHLSDLSMIAVQGPRARDLATEVLGHGSMSGSELEQISSMKPFNAGEAGGMFIARTGYTGEDGFEIVVPDSAAPGLWQSLADAGVAPCGLGARDTLRLEAGMNLYGQDMNEDSTPFESGLGWTVSFKNDREFIGRDALVRQKENGVPQRQVGLILEDRGVLRPGQAVNTNQFPGTGDSGDGIVTSGSFSPTLSKAIALARVPVALSDKVDGEECVVDVRGKWLKARVVSPPFVRHGQACEGVI